jgi:lipopolysaccharide/colanic/teichoic acid biosynthesis glycosyltransferase
MRLRSPASKSSLRMKLSSFDLFWALAAPVIALGLRDPGLLEASGFPQSLPPAYQYVLITVICAVPAFLFFRISDGMTHFFSVHDVLAVCGAVATTIASSSLLLFVFTRMEGVPRSTPLICGLVLAAGLIVGRTVARVYYKAQWTQREKGDAQAAPHDLRRVILIGVDRFAGLTIKLTDHQSPRTTQVVAALDSREAFVGRTINGVKIVGLIHDLEAVVDEFAVHGVDVDEVWLSDDVAGLPRDVLERMSEQCATRGLKFARISEALNLTPQSGASSHASQDNHDGTMDLDNYFKLKRVIDVIAASALLMALAPLALVAACLVLFDVGAPVMFWQQRVGRHGRKFLLYKFRTYHAPFDRHGAEIPSNRRLSKIGRAIRAGRLDEIPQLLNVLIGDMSLIGPRPLLPQDQPSDPRIRLLVRPGITGWAQINGATIVTPAEKDALDVWYIRHASLWLDLKVVVRTLWFAVTGEKLNHAALTQALSWREAHLGGSERSRGGDGSLESALGSRSQ